MAEDIGELRAKISADLSGLQSGLRRADSMLSSFGGGMTKVGKQVGSVGDSLMGVSAVAALGLGAGIKVAMDFEGAMKEIEVRAGLTAEELDEVSAYALQMGKTTAFSGEEAADGLLQLLTSGNDLKESMELLKPVMDLAASSNLELGYSADATTDIMAMFGLTTNDAVDIVNLLSGAAGASSATAGDLIDALTNVGTVAAGMGYSLDETIAALAVLADNGMKGAEAGTRLKSALLNMHTNQDAIDALKELGVALYTPEGATRPLDEVIADLKEAMKDMTDEEKIGYLERLGGAYGGTALNALLAGMGIGVMTEKINGMPSAADLAKQAVDTFEGRLDALGDTVKAVAIEALTPFMNKYLKPLVSDHLIPLVGKVGEWISANGPLTMGIVAAAAAVALLSVGLKIIGGLLAAGGAVLGGLASFATAAWAALGPISLLAAGVGALALAYEAFGRSADEAKQKAENAVTLGGANPAGGFLAESSVELNPVGGAQTGSFGQPVATMGGGTVVVEASADLEALAGMGYDPSTALTALATGGLGMSETLQILAAFGIPGDATIQSLVDTGVLPSSILEELTAMGLPPSTSLGRALSGGLPPSANLAALIAQGLTVHVNVGVEYNRDGSAAPVQYKGPRAKGGDVTPGGFYLVGEEGPELLSFDRSGYITPMSDVGFSSGGGIVIQNLSIFANSVEELYDQLEQEARNRGAA